MSDDRERGQHHLATASGAHLRLAATSAATPGAVASLADTGGGSHRGWLRRMTPATSLSEVAPLPAPQGLAMAPPANPGRAAALPPRRVPPPLPGSGRPPTPQSYATPAAAAADAAGFNAGTLEAIFMCQERAAHRLLSYSSDYRRLHALESAHLLERDPMIGELRGRLAGDPIFRLLCKLREAYALALRLPTKPS